VRTAATWKPGRKQPLFDLPPRHSVGALQWPASQQSNSQSRRAPPVCALFPLRALSSTTDESQSRKLQNLNQPAKFCHLIFRKIINFEPTRCQILRLKCTKFNFGWGFAPDPTGGAYSALFPTPLLFGAPAQYVPFGISR